jgi:hypothetical protein
MTSQDHAALALYQATKNEDRAVADAMLEQFFSFPTLADYEATQERVAEEFAQ